MKAINILKNAKKLIKKKENWTTGNLARNSNNEGIAVDHPDATKFCAAGAVWKAAGIKPDLFPIVKPSGFTKARRLLDKAALALKYVDVISLNDDGQSHTKVMKMFTKAIELAETK